MVDKMVTRHVGLVLIITAHMALNVLAKAKFTGILGTNITLQFTFSPHINFTTSSHFAIYWCTTGSVKIAEYLRGKEGNVFHVDPKNTSVFWHITNLKLNDTGIYKASLFNTQGPAIESEHLQLTVQKENGNTTVPPMQNKIPVTEDSGTSSHFVTVLVVSPAVLFAALLPGLVWCLVRHKDNQQQPPQQSSNPTVQETVEVSKNVPSSSLVYSVLELPTRSSAVLEIRSDTEYAAVSYLTETK